MEYVQILMGKCIDLVEALVSCSEHGPGWSRGVDSRAGSKWILRHSRDVRS